MSVKLLHQISPKEPLVAGNRMTPHLMCDLRCTDSPQSTLTVCPSWKNSMQILLIITMRLLIMRCLALTLTALYHWSLCFHRSYKPSVLRERSNSKITVTEGWNHDTNHFVLQTMDKEYTLTCPINHSHRNQANMYCVHK